MMNNVRGHHNSCRLNTEYPRFSLLDSKTISARMVVGIRMAEGMAVLYQQVVYPFPVWNEKLLVEISPSRIDLVCEELICVLS